MASQEELIKHSENMDEAIEELLLVMEKHYPGISKQVYEKGTDQWTLPERMKLALNFELIFMGIIK